MNSDLDPSAELQMECYIVLYWKSSFMRLIAVFEIVLTYCHIEKVQCKLCTVVKMGNIDFRF